MKNSEVYQKILARKTTQPSLMGIIPYDDINNYSYEGIIESIQRSGEFNKINLSINHDKDCLQGTIRYIIYEFPVEISIVREKFNMVDIEAKKEFYELNDGEVQGAINANGYIEAVINFTNDSLISYLAQIKLLNIISSKVAILVDMSAYKLLSGSWMTLTASSSTPPSADYLYTIHIVGDDEDKNEGLWFHTHGLYRCGILEIEMLRIVECVEEQYNYLKGVVNVFLKKGMLKEGQPISVGYSKDKDIVYTWLPWERSLRRLADKKWFVKSKRFLGDRSDRGNDVHDGPSAVLFAYDNGKLLKPDYYSKIISENPIVYISTEETSRMASIAEERFFHFKEIFNQYKSNEEWSFILKIGCLTDEARKTEDREHLWFEVQEMNDRDFKGKLMNDPYSVSDMKKDNVYNLRLSNLSDWIIYSPNESFSPDSIYKYFQIYESV